MCTTLFKWLFFKRRGYTKAHRPAANRNELFGSAGQQENRSGAFREPPFRFSARSRGNNLDERHRAELSFCPHSRARQPHCLPFCAVGRRGLLPFSGTARSSARSAVRSEKRSGESARLQKRECWRFRSPGGDSEDYCRPSSKKGRGRRPSGPPAQKMPPWTKEARTMAFAAGPPFSLSLVAESDRENSVGVDAVPITETMLSVGRLTFRWTCFFICGQHEYLQPLLPFA